MKNFKKILLNNLGQDLRAIRKEKGLSQQDVALQTDLSLGTLNAIENCYPVAYGKYFRLLRFYGKKLKVKIADMT